MSKAEKDSLDQEIRKIAGNPNIGEEKKGDLREIFVHKFKIKNSPIPARLSKDWHRLGTCYGRAT